MFIKSINNLILKQADKLTYSVGDFAPSTERDLFNAGTLKVWSGQSDRTIFNDPKVNHAFRALHDALHLKTGLGFTVPEEIELGRIQANQYSGLMADLVFIEVAGQAQYFAKTGHFLKDQVKFTLDELKKLGYSLK